MPPPATTTVRVVIRLKPKANPACDTAVEVVRPDPGAEARAVLMGQQFSKALAPPPRVPLTSPPSLRSSTQAASVVITKPGADVEGVYQVCVRVCARREIWVKKRRRVSPGSYAPARARSRSTPPPPPHPHTYFPVPFRRRPRPGRLPGRPLHRRRRGRRRRRPRRLPRHSARLWPDWRRQDVRHDRPSL